MPRTPETPIDLMAALRASLDLAKTSSQQDHAWVARHAGCQTGRPWLHTPAKSAMVAHDRELALDEHVYRAEAAYWVALGTEPAISEVRRLDVAVAAAERLRLRWSGLGVADWYVDRDREDARLENLRFDRKCVVCEEPLDGCGHPVNCPLDPAVIEAAAGHAHAIRSLGDLDARGKAISNAT